MWYGNVYSSTKSSMFYVWPVRSGQSGSLVPSEIWKTGQTTGYASGDDGDLQKGVSWPVPRFNDHTDGTVTDNLTGLMWSKNANLPDENQTWQGALDYVKSINNGAGLGGYHDWRLPNRKELFSLIDSSKYDPTLPTSHPFQNVQSDYYWSSTTYAYDTDYAWVVHMWSGYVDGYLKSDSYFVWPVRSGQGPLGYPDISVTPNPVEFGSVNVGATSEKQVIIKNDGNANLVIGTITSPTSPFSKATDNCSGQTIAPNATCTVMYRFAPTTSGNFSSNSNIPSNDPDENPVTVTLNGTGSTAPSITVSKSGAGTGTVTSSPAGINCGDDCSEVYTQGTKVTLTAKADVNSTFTGWSGGGCTGTKTCTVTVDSEITVTASFALKTPDISVARTSLDFGSVKVGKKVTKTLKITNNGSGDLVITLSGVEGTDFSIQGSSSVTIKSKQSYTPKVLFTPKSAGLKTATLKIDSNDPDTPILDIELHGSTIEQPQQFTLTVTKAGPGSGTVTSNPAGINCGNDCSESYDQGTSVTLTATPASGSTFGGWSGACSGTGTCVVIMNADIAVTAALSARPPAISVSPSSLDFGSVKIGKKVTKTLKITNNSSRNLMITLSGLEGTDFSIQGSSSVTIKAKKSYSLKVLFTPKSAGLETAPLMIGSNNPDTPTIEISLNGTGQ
jgi:hypothetical protein